MNAQEVCQQSSALPFSIISIVPFTTKSKKLTVAFTTNDSSTKYNNHIYQQDNIKNNPWHGLCFYFLQVNTQRGQGDAITSIE
jgi:hypothetical protein